MHLVIVSHKPCWNSEDQPDKFLTDGGFPLQVSAISGLFDKTTVLVPCQNTHDPKGLSPLVGKNLNITPLSTPKGIGFRRKLDIPFWLIKNSKIIWSEIRRSDAVHTPIPGDVGTFGLLFALLLRKPLFVRHCGNWLIQRTVAEQFWKWLIEYFAGGKNVMFATGGTKDPPSKKNPNIKWIFSTSLLKEKINKSKPISFPANGQIKLITACRLENRKGVDVVIKSLPLILEHYPKTTLDIIGGGTLEAQLKELVNKLELNNKVNFHGKIEQSKVIEMMKQAHIFCFPTSASEGFPKVVIEALASGLPVITTKVSVLPELIENGGGILLDEPTSQNMEKAVKTILEDKEQYHQISTNAINTARQYSLENWREFIGDNLCKAWKVSSLSSTQ
jgi:glycosyltransferase involved in cell wall biosynthesis